MKKLTFILALAMLTLLTQCKKQVLNENNEQIEGIQMVLQADNGSSKTDIGANGAISWKTQEKIYVVANGKCVGYVTNGSTGGNTFWGTLSGITSNGTYDFHFYYIGNRGNVYWNGNLLISNGATSYTMDFSNQDGTLSNLADFHVGYGSQTGVVVTSGSAVTHATMKSLVSMAYFDIASMAEPGEKVYFYGDNINNKLRLDFSTNTPVYSKVNPEKINLICAGTVAEGPTSPCYVMLLPNHTNGTEELPTDFTFVSQRTTGTCNDVFNYGIVGGRFYCNEGNVDVPIPVSATYQKGILVGEFSVSDTKKVRFSQGNLQYIGSATTPYWKFAENQYDYLGSNGQAGNNQSYDRDLFSWGTSNYNHGAVCYQPWSSSKDNYDYWAYGDKTLDLNNGDGRADWGYNAISNGENTENSGWFTLTQSEWIYLLDTRTTTSGMRWAKAKINNVNGLLLLPDNWDDSYYILNNANTTSSNYTSNTISTTDWNNNLQVHGVVFLPAAGSRQVPNLSGVGSYCYYQSATHKNAVSAYSVYCNTQSFSSSNDLGHWIGCSVRLVRNAQ